MKALSILMAIAGVFLLFAECSELGTFLASKFLGLAALTAALLAYTWKQEVRYVNRRI